MTDDLTHDETDQAQVAEVADDFADADAFFAAEVLLVQAAPLRLYGRTYTLPARTPLMFALLVERYEQDTSLDALRTVLTPVFGPDALDHWIERGIDEHQLAVVLAWAAANMRQPGSTSLQQAAAAVADREQDLGKAQTAPTPRNRTERRRAGSGGPSSRTGRSSKRT
ncbi:hypothetical protein [Kitasatospora viridis]|uniref:Tail assembly chaperone n=1 Tax=Kitasatospora viridis TaxID=281105 RepID=A0A561UKM1_9ACTN|nr:hypothetical protein [Kitasatospora viridis]TWF99909.1 hypothetical protein FHX73_113769 [Kitasatospora viridis]